MKPVFISFIYSVTCLLVLLGGGKNANAQSVSEIKASREFLYGEGKGYTLKEADDAALSDLIKKISVTIQSDFISEERELASGDKVMSETDYRSIINTYSSATLSNTERMIIKDEPDAEVFRYVRKSEIDRIFKSRAEKAVFLVENAGKSLEKRQIDDALRQLYWSFCLVKSLRYPNEAKMFVDGKDQLLVTWLPYKIEEVLGGLSLSVKKRSETDYDLYASYLGEPVKSMDYTYFDGADYSGIHSILDAYGTVELRSGYAGENLTVKIEYEFAGRAVCDREVEDVMKAQKKSLFKKANIRIDLRKVSSTEGLGTAVAVDRTLAMDSSAEEYIDKVLKVSNSVKSLNPQASRSLFNDDGWEDFRKLLSYGAIMVNDDQHLDCFCTGNDIVCRGLSCSFRFGKSRVFNESLSFCFDRDGKISHVALGLGKMGMNDILEKSRWGVDSRKRLISFLEDYRTAYATKNIEYLKLIFSDDALIIVGSKVRSVNPSSDMIRLNSDRVVLKTYPKEEFIRRLQTSFMNKEYINLHFSDIDIIKLRQDEEKYAIQLQQDYYSSNYGDKGYLYLLVDLTDAEKPVIHVRTWQPDKDPDFGINGIFTKGSF